MIGLPRTDVNTSYERQARSKQWERWGLSLYSWDNECTTAGNKKFRRCIVKLPYSLSPCVTTTELLLKLLKKLMFFPVQRCQNTQCIAIGCIWGCIAADPVQSGCPCWPLSTTKSSYNGYMSITTEPQSNGRRWPGLMTCSAGKAFSHAINMDSDTYPLLKHFCRPVSAGQSKNGSELVLGV